MVQQLARQIGKAEAQRLLVIHGISLSTAMKLVRNTYPSKIGILVGAAIERAAEDGRKHAS